MALQFNIIAPRLLTSSPIQVVDIYAPNAIRIGDIPTSELFPYTGEDIPFYITKLRTVPPGAFSYMCYLDHALEYTADNAFGETTLRVSLRPRGTVNYTGTYTVATLSIDPATTATVSAANVLYTQVRTRAAVTIGDAINISSNIYATAAGKFTRATHFWATNNISGGGGPSIDNYTGLNVQQLPYTATNAAGIMLSEAYGAFPSYPTNIWSIYNEMLGNSYHLCPVIRVAIHKTDNFTELTWGATGVWALGQKWRATIAAGGSITLVNPARGGIVDLYTPVAAGVANPTFLDENNILGWSLRDRPVVFTRWRAVQTADTRQAIGWTDDVDEGAGDPMPYTQNAVLVMVDTAVGNFYYLVGVRAGARTNVDSTVAVDANHHRFMILPRYDNSGTWVGMELWVDGVSKCSLTAAQCPVNTTMMQCLSGYVQNLAVGAVDKHQRVDKVEFGLRTNTGTGDT
jgi:hypothetical protein